MSTPTAAPKRLRFGDGVISGYLSVFLGAVSLGAVLCFHFPEYLTTAEFRSQYPLELLRYLLLGCLVLAFGFALSSVVLSRQATLGFVGVLLCAAAIVLGGTSLEIDDFEQSVYSISLDWLLIDIVVLSVIFILVELFLPKRRTQTKLHEEWRTDLVYFAMAIFWCNTLRWSSSTRPKSGSPVLA